MKIYYSEKGNLDSKIIDNYCIKYYDSGIILILFELKNEDNYYNIDTWLISLEEGLFGFESEEFRTVEIMYDEKINYQVSISECDEQIGYYLIPFNLITK